MQLLLQICLDCTFSIYEKMTHSKMPREGKGLMSLTVEALASDR